VDGEEWTIEEGEGRKEREGGREENVNSSDSIRD